MFTIKVPLFIMKHLFRLLFSLVFFFLFQGVHGQSIINLSIIPTQPTSSDTIYVIAETMHPNSPCPISTSSLNLSGDSVMAYATHTPGMLPAICTSTDTMLVGQLNEGLYTLVYHLENPHGAGYLDTDVLHFMVAEPGSFAYIDSLIVFPPLITEDDSVFLVSHSTFPSSPCNLTNHLLTSGAGHLYSEAWHTSGSLGTICHTTDTFALGKLSPGSYTITHTILDSATSLRFDSSTISFQVHQSPSDPTIQSLEIIPYQPNDQDSLMLRVSTRFDWHTCKLTHHQQTGTSSAPDVHGYYKWGDSLTTCHSVDTIFLGAYNPGSYTLTYYLHDSVTLDTMDVSTITFDVQLANFILSGGENEHVITLYPNPANTHFVADLSTTPKKPVTMTIYSSTGQAIKTLSLTKEIQKVDITHLSPGLYFVFFTDNKGNNHSFPLIKDTRGEH